jgi:SAM-dependent methyltransferase
MIGPDADYDLEALAWSIDGDLEADFHFFRDFLLTSPGLALDAGCGTGRLLIEYLRLGFQLEACDICPQMVALCRKKAEAAGLRPPIYTLAIQNLPFTGRYSAIYLACGTFMCITGEGEVERCLKALYRNLAPGGRLALSIMLPKYLHLAGGPFPSAWEEYYSLTLPDGQGELVVDWRAHAIDRSRQLIEEENRYRLIANGAIVREEFHLGRHHWYTPEQVAALLEDNGFTDVAVYADYQPGPPQATSHSMCVVATRGS